MATSFPGFRRGPITAQCSSKDSQEIVVTVEKPTAATANADAFLVHYKSGGQDRTVKQTLAIQLCGPSDPSKICK